MFRSGGKALTRAPGPVRWPQQGFGCAPPSRPRLPLQSPCAGSSGCAAWGVGGGRGCVRMQHTGRCTPVARQPYLCGTNATRRTQGQSYWVSSVVGPRVCTGGSTQNRYSMRLPSETSTQAAPCRLKNSRRQGPSTGNWSSLNLKSEEAGPALLALRHTPAAAAALHALLANHSSAAHACCIWLPSLWCFSPATPKKAPKPMASSLQKSAGNDKNKLRRE